MARKSHLLNGLNKEQAKAVTHGPGPLLIVAGAGSGKTTVITRRVAWLVEQKLAKPNEILALTFTDKAAAEMEERVDRLLPYGYLDLWISTFHSFCQRILESHALEIGLPVNFKLLTPNELWVLIRQNLEQLNLDYYRPLGNPSRFIHALISHFSRAKDELIAPEEYLAYSRELGLDLDRDPSTRSAKKTREPGQESRPEMLGDDPARVREVASAYAAYQKLLVDNNALDFGDLINYTYQLFQKRPAVLARYRRQFKFVLIDEFQDTNLAQYELVKLLAAPDNNVTVVGDDDQSIYKFRGASVSNILKFQDNYPKAGQITLIRNYRSFQNLLDASYQFIQLNNPDRLEERLNICKKLVAERKGTGGVTLKRYQDYHAEAEGVIARITQLKRQHIDATWSDFAILVRSNEAAEVFVDTLDRVGLPYMHLSRRGLYRKPIIIDALSYFRLLDNYHESRALFRVLNLPVFGFSHDDLAKTLDLSNRKAYSLYETIKHPALVSALSVEGQGSAKKLLALVEKHTQLARSRPINELFVEVVSDLRLAKEGKDEAGRGQDLNYLDQLNRKIKDFAVASETKLLRNFMEEIEMELAAGEEGRLEFDPDVGPEAIKIITVHSAKGLEFRFVFLVALADRKFPAVSRAEPIELPEKLIKDILPSGDFHIQEERRLFYVGITRARDGVYFSYAQDYGGSSARKASIFLKELGLTEEEQVLPPLQATLIIPKEAKKKAVYSLPKTFSFTSISDFRKCPLEYKYRYVLKIPEKGKPAFSFGQTIHRTLENFLRAYEQHAATSQGELFGSSSSKSPEKKIALPSLADLLEFYEESWVDEWFEDKRQKEDYRKQGRKMLEMLYAKFQAIPPAPKYLEQKFKFGLGSYVFVGKIDRADVGPQGIVIIDYKTGAGADRPFSPVDKEQLLIYQIAAEEYLTERVADLQYWYLKDKLDIRSFLGKAEDLQKVKKGLLATIERIVEATAHDSFGQLHTKHQNCQFKDMT